MRLSFSTNYCSKVHYSRGLVPSIIRPSLRRPTWVRMDCNHSRPKDKIIVIMGATGTGKSRLSVDLASRFLPAAEVINSDKMQLYHGLDITTNKIPPADRRSVPHHLLGDLDPAAGDLSPAHFRTLARSTISDILARHKVPLIVGGSNSFIHALVSAESTHRLDSDEFGSVSAELHYDCCFLCVDVSFPVLCDYLLKRVDDMFDSGMLAELAEFYDSVDDSVVKPGVGLRKAIGVPEFEQYFRCFPPATALLAGAVTGGGGTRMDTHIKMDLCRKVVFAQAVDSIKYNTCQLAMKQMRKIERLRARGWDLRRLNATEAFRAVLLSDSGESSSSSSSEIWEKKVVQPSVKVVKRFLEG